jgi:hypothetical protein
MRRVKLNLVDSAALVVALPQLAAWAFGVDDIGGSTDRRHRTPNRSGVIWS